MSSVKFYVHEGKLKTIMQTVKIKYFGGSKDTCTAKFWEILYWNLPDAY